ncbi:type IV secretion system DNA-binding domain-containing protein [Aureimonas sp. D3]|uniref:type IV secretion system DNA-binding domain-containing protein n=1 Tax=Aureimonas sp. D3 TaxID=1638164 RepID=UPI0007823575|nr:type IV secretion system DNA-binding domain-containing protein [Aureimonas sp. D3]
MIPFGNLNVGYNPRRHPGKALLTSALMGGAAFAFALAVPLALAPVRDARDSYYAVWEPHQLQYQIASGDDDALRARVNLALVIALLVGGRVVRLAWRDTPHTDPFSQPDDADPMIHRDEEAEMRLNNAFRVEAKPGANVGLAIAPHIVIPRQLELRNIMILGAPGSGKSNILRAYAQQAIERGDFVVLHCTKGDVTQAFQMKEIVLISPTHRDGWAWDIGADIDGPAAAAEFVIVVIPSSDQPFWADTARLVLIDLIIMIIADKGADWNARDLLAMVLQPPDAIREQIERLDLSASPVLAGGGEDGMSKTVEGILATMTSGALKTLRPMAYAWSSYPPERRFSVKRALAPGWQGPRVLIVQSHPDYKVLSTSICGGVLRRLCQAVASPTGRGPRPQVTMALDEFYSLGQIEGIDQSLSVAREHGMACMIALQSVWQLRKLYGDANELISDLFQIKIYGRQVPGEATERAVRDLGARKITGTKLNKTGDSNDTRRTIGFEEKLDVFSATQFAGELGLFDPDTPEETIRGILHFAGTAYRIDWPPTRWQAQSQGFVAAEWTKRPTLKPTAGESEGC